MKPYRILLYEDMHQAGKNLLADKAEILMANSLDEDALVEQVKDIDAIIIRANGSVTARIMDAAPRLKVIGRHGVGVEAIDLTAAKARGIAVCNTPDANVESVAEQAVGFMIVLSKQIQRADKAIRQGRWSARYDYIGQEMLGHTLGLVGMGRIGSRVAEICNFGFRMPVIYYDVVRYPLIEEKLEARQVVLDEVLDQADIISVHVPLLPSTRNILGREQFARMKKGAILINTARGGVLDEDAMIESLKMGHLGGAGLDVFSIEPAPPDHPLFQMENVIMSPHMAAHTDDALKAMSMIAVDILRVLSGKKPAFRVA